MEMGPVNFWDLELCGWTRCPFRYSKCSDVTDLIFDVKARRGWESPRQIDGFVGTYLTGEDVVKEPR